MSFQAQTAGDRKVATQQEVMLMQNIHMFFCLFFVFSGPSNSLVASTTFDMREHLAFNRGASTLASIALIVMCSMLTIVSSGPYVSTGDSNVAPPSSLPYLSRSEADRISPSWIPSTPSCTSLVIHHNSRSFLFLPGASIREKHTALLKYPKGSFSRISPVISMAIFTILGSQLLSWFLRWSDESPKERSKNIERCGIRAPLMDFRDESCHGLVGEFEGG